MVWTFQLFLVVVLVKFNHLYVCLNKPFNAYLVNGGCHSKSRKTHHIAPKVTIYDWIKAGLEYLKVPKAMVKKSFLICGTTNALDSSENQFIRCATKLASMQLPHVDKCTNDLFMSD